MSIDRQVEKHSHLIPETLALLERDESVPLQFAVQSFYSQTRPIGNKVRKKLFKELPNTFRAKLGQTWKTLCEERRKADWEKWEERLRREAEERRSQRKIDRANAVVERAELLADCGSHEEFLRRVAAESSYRRSLLLRPIERRMVINMRRDALSTYFVRHELRCTMSELNRWHADGRLPHWFRVGSQGSRRWHNGDVEEAKAKAREWRVQDKKQRAARRMAASVLRRAA